MIQLPMSGDEVMVTILATILAAVVWAFWYRGTAPLWPAHRVPPGRGPLWIAPLLAAALIFAVLTTVAASDVVGDARYVTMYFAMGMAWVGLSTRLFPLMGVHLRDDVIERRNPAAAPAMGGAIIGTAAAYAGGNIGDGPGWWVVVASACMATAGLMAAWHLLESFTGVAESITVERDAAAGWRLGGFLVAVGLVLGRALAGDWVSAGDTFIDAAKLSWPVLVLLAQATVFERSLRVSMTAPSRGVSSQGQMPALVMIAVAVAWIAWLGIPQ